MKDSFLLPNQYKVFGLIITAVFGILGYFCMSTDFKIPNFQIYEPQDQSSFSFSDYNLTNELAFLGVTVGLLMISFAKEKMEDELIVNLRLRSLQWSVLISFSLLIIISFSAYGLGFLFLLVYNVWTVLLVFIIKFHVCLYQLKKESRDEK